MDHRLLCEKALIAGPTLHCTLIYGWNLLTRPDTTYNVKWAHFARVDDHNDQVDPLHLFYALFSQYIFPWREFLIKRAFLI